MSDRRVGRRLSSSLGLLSVAVNVFIAIQAEGSELDSSSVNLSVARHTHSFFLVEDTALMVMMAGSTGGSLGCSFSSGGSESAGRGGMLLLSSGDGCSSNTGRVLSRVPRVSGGACYSTSRRRFGFVNNLFKI